MTVLSVKSVEFAYPSNEDATPLLKRTSFEIGAGTLALLLGPSGSGKSTLLAIIAGLLEPVSGDVAVQGNNYDWRRPDEIRRCRREKLGMVFQQPCLLLDLSALDNVRELIIATGMKSAFATALAHNELAELGLEERLHQRARHLSIGQRQRVSLARALVREPKLLLADEPTAALDEKSAELVMKRIVRQVRGSDRAALIVTHDVRLERFADIVFQLDRGQVTKRGSTP